MHMHNTKFISFCNCTTVVSNSPLTVLRTYVILSTYIISLRHSHQRRTKAMIFALHSLPKVYIPLHFCYTTPSMSSPGGIHPKPYIQPTRSTPCYAVFKQHAAMPCTTISPYARSLQTDAGIMQCHEPIIASKTGKRLASCFEQRNAK